MLKVYHVVFQQKTWRKFRAPKGVVTPKGRRSHTATVFKDSMFIYGGYKDLKGSTSEMWTFHFGELQLGLTATTASPMAGYGRGHSFFLKMAMVAEF